MPASASPLVVSALRERIAAIGADGQARALRPAAAFASLGHAGADQALGGGLRRGALHEVRSTEPAAPLPACGFALGMTARLTGAGARAAHWLWVRQDFCSLETGSPYGPGLAAYGLDPSRLILVTVADAADALRAAEEGLRCPALGVVLVEPWGDPRTLDLTATRRLALAAESSGVTAVLLRPGAREGPGGAATRWMVGPAPSLPTPARGVGRPAFTATLARSRQSGADAMSAPARAEDPKTDPDGAEAGREGDRWIMEWNPDEHAFRDARRDGAGRTIPNRDFTPGALAQAGGLPSAGAAPAAAASRPLEAGGAAPKEIRTSPAVHPGRRKAG
jgi:protein ImuA